MNNKNKQFDSTFVRASDLPELISQINQKSTNQAKFSHVGDFEKFLTANNTSLANIHIQRIEKPEAYELSKIKFAISYNDSQTNNFSSKFQFFCKDMIKNSWITIAEFTVQDKDVYSKLKQNIDFLCSFSILQTLQIFGTK